MEDHDPDPSHCTENIRNIATLLRGIHMQDQAPDRYPPRHEENIRNIATLLRCIQMEDHDCDPPRREENIRNIATLLRSIQMGDHNHDPDRDPPRSEENTRNIATLLRSIQMRDLDPDLPLMIIHNANSVHRIEPVAKINLLQLLSKGNVPLHRDLRLKFQQHHLAHSLYCQGYPTHLLQRGLQMMMRVSTMN